MEFSKKTQSSADSVASLALINSMLRNLIDKKIFSEDDVKEIKRWAIEQIPKDAVVKYEEAIALIDQF